MNVHCRKDLGVTEDKLNRSQVFAKKINNLLNSKKQVGLIQVMEKDSSTLNQL